MKNFQSVNGGLKNKQVEPDYEVIEFGQYSNAPLVHTKVPKSMAVAFLNSNIFLTRVFIPESNETTKHCQLCGSSAPCVQCEHCLQIFCLSCDDMYHRHPKRQTHIRRVSIPCPR